MCSQESGRCAELALMMKPIEEAKAKERQLSTLKQNSTDVQNSAPRETGKTRDTIADLAGVSHDTIRAREVSSPKLVPGNQLPAGSNQHEQKSPVC